MNCPFYRVFVGKYEKSTETKPTSEKLRKLGLTPSVFKTNDGYSLLISSSLRQEYAETLLTNLIRKGFDAYLEEPTKA